MAVDLKFGKKHKIKEDRFIEGLFQFRTKVQTNKKTILITFAAVAGAAIIVLIALQMRTRSSNEARAVFGQAMMEYQSGRYTTAISSFKKITDNFAGSPSASKAMFLTGSIYYELGNYGLAVEAYKKYISKYDESDFLNAAVYKGLGCAYMQMKDYDNAVSAFKTGIRKYSGDYSVPEMRCKLARCYIEKKDASAAKTELEAVLKDNPASAFAKEADLILSTL
jgi:TolA-binding protein